MGLRPPLAHQEIDMATFPGAYTAIVTPFADGAVDYGTLDALVERQIAGGIDGIVAVGTTGESPTLSHAEHDEVVARITKAVAGRCKVIAGAGSNNTTESVRLAKHAASVGVDGLLVVNPYYNKPSQRGLYEHFSTVARSVDIPVMLYNIPGRTGVTLAVDTIARLHADNDNIVAVKHATGQVPDAAALHAVSDIEVLSGDDPLTLALMAQGGVGVVSVVSNLAPRMVKRLTDAMLAGDLKGGREAHRALFSLAAALLSLDTNPAPIKAAMAIKGLCRDELRLPMMPVTDEVRERVRQLVAGDFS